MFKIYIISLILLCNINTSFCQTNKDSVETAYIKIKPDSFRIIRFKSLATAGFIWFFENPDSLVIRVSKKANDFGQTDKRIGDSGYEVFDVKALRTGKARLVFNLERPWNRSAIIRTKIYMVDVR